MDEELECPGCGELVDVTRPLGVEVRVHDSPTYTSRSGTVIIDVGGAMVHRCDARASAAEAVARRVGELLTGVDDEAAGTGGGGPRSPGVPT